MTTVLQLSCSVNILEGFNDKKADSYILTEIDKSINRQQYSDALALFQTLSSDAKEDRDNKVVLATIYFGLCGVEKFLKFVNDLGQSGGATLFITLMRTFKGADDTSVANCINAENAIKSIDTDATKRTTKENILMAFISMAKIGNILHNKLDTDDDDNADGVDVCNTSTPLDTASAKEVATGVGNMLISIAAAPGSSVGSGQASAITTVCSIIDSTPGLGSTYNFCALTDTANVTATHEKGIRSIIKENTNLGLGVSCTGDLTTCNCP